MEKKWLSINLDRAKADALRAFLKMAHIKYEASENWNLIHFEVFVDNDERKRCNEFLEVL